MNAYLFVSKIRIQTALAYRFNVISTILIQCLIMYAMSCFWAAAYSGAEKVSGASQRDMITYTTISVIMGNLPDGQRGPGSTQAGEHLRRLSGGGPR